MTKVPSLAELGWLRLPDRPDPPPGSRPARVLRHDGAAVLVGDGERLTQHHLPRSWSPVTVGDWLLVDDVRPTEVLPRRSLLRRRDPSSGDDQLLAANVDLVGIVCGLDRPVRAGRIERLVTLVWDSGATPLVVLTKVDLVDDTSVPSEIARSSAPGCDVVAVSADDEEAVADLRARLRGGTLVLLGESGAGKSTLVNRLLGGEAAATGAVRAGDRKGRHTTTARQLHAIDGGCVIDSPGIREVGLVASDESVDDTFAEISALAQECRFTDCAHEHEPGCAVRAAVEDGTIDVERLRRWEALRKEAAAAELRADEHARRRRDRQRKLMARDAQEVKRRRRGG
jgi:ribosome biogenesis GTPase